ncbi:polysaccharide deacetylase family protein [Winogradskyella sp.]|uniref:polysaccharide deacetylase family protein n=1 Tax=Winogradskyella sp. TaxID=1883156 RepID=UPI0025FEF73F|nr:polysaccharide deacetylase family protein [Winogradskyella sp.]MBT8245213.1 polysaccharide deacetylase family protein [Winogradskyella sp.]
MLLVYTHKITPRLTYIFKHLCKRILGVEVSFTSKIEDFIAHDSIKMSYARQPLSKEFFVRSHALLFEQGLSDIEIAVNDWEDTKGFFTTGEGSDLPYDIFAASFYLLSRYEEYLPHVNDDYGRFLASESLAKKEGFLESPIIDVWAYKLKAILQDRFPDFDFPSRTYNITPIIDVPSAFKYSNKGLMRSIGGAFEDLFRLKFRQLYQRVSVLFGFKKDPHYTFTWLINRQKSTESKFIVFFVVGEYSTYDKSISLNKKEFTSLIKSVGDYCHVGLKASYFALDNLEMLKKEKQKLEEITNVDLYAIRNSHSKLNLPKTYRNAVELEIPREYTMGYINELGFRAGTCTPFLFYDLDYEVQTPLQIHPFHCMDFALLKYNSQLDKEEKLERLINTVKKVDGTFSSVFHNYSLSDDETWSGFKTLFNQIINSVNE